MKINIIDPSSTEFNRGSFCYAPYLVYNALSKLIADIDDDVRLFESFTPEELDTLPDADLHIITLWSYPQIESCLMLAENLPFMFGKNNVYFVGYNELIKHQGFRNLSVYYGSDVLSDPQFLKIAMETYPENYKRFKRLLLSDCDMHLKHLDEGEKVYPLFTSYGCPNGCSFCPSTVNCGKTRLELDLRVVYRMLNDCIAQGIKNIHFTDEDFFFNVDRAHTILNYLADKGMHLIALASADCAVEYIEKYGTGTLKAAGLEVMEVGFESGDETQSRHMGIGKSLTACEELAIMQDNGVLPFNIFWLILTFFPGETIRSLNATGEFMMQHGFEMEEVMGRLRTNGTKGGLGQFFQPYHGTPLFHTLEKNGMFLTERPVRLQPSYIPNSFLDSVIVEKDMNRMNSALPYLKLYNTTPYAVAIETGKKIRDYLVKDNPYANMKIIIMMAILARMGVIK